MAVISRFIPFFLTPSSWFLRGDARAYAKARYTNSGRDLALAIAEIDAKGDAGALERARLRIDRKHGLITQYEHDVAMAKLEHTVDLDLSVALLEIDAQHGKIDQKKADKEIATLRKQPWVGLIDDGYNAEDGISGFYFEFDWNEYWIEDLRHNGYYGANDEVIMQQWFADICRTEAADIPALTSANSGPLAQYRTI